jgi:hypothetical protein
MIYIIITSSINNKVGVQNDKHRMDRYIECINSAISLSKKYDNMKIIVVENNGERKTFLNDIIGCDVVYTYNNFLNFKHKGVNELHDIKHVIQKYNINDDDFVIKLTGRYKLLDDLFLSVVFNESHHFDAFLKFYNVCTHKFLYDDCILGLIAVKCKYIKSFNYLCIKSPEVEFATHIRKNVSNIKEMQELHLECCFADDLRIIVF